MKKGVATTPPKKNQEKSTIFSVKSAEPKNYFVLLSHKNKEHNKKRGFHCQIKVQEALLFVTLRFIY